MERQKRIYLAAVIASALAGCGDDSKSADVADAMVVDAQAATDATQSVTETVGSSGGTVESPSGVSVSIPSGALDNDVDMTVEPVPSDEISASLPSDTQLAGTTHRFAPHGTTFLSPVTISLPYTGSANTVLRLDDDNDTTWEEVLGASFASGVATFETSSFSLYAAANTTATTCGPPGTGTAGIVTFDGGSFTAVDAAARRTDMTGVATEGGSNPFRTVLRIRLTDYSNACGLENDDIRSKDFRHFVLSFNRNSDSAQPGLPAVGTYPVNTTLPMLNDGTTYFRGGGELWDGDGECTETGSLGSLWAVSSVTLTAVTANSVEGTFAYTYNSVSHSGSFTAPICGDTLVADDTYCCWTP